MSVSSVRYRPPPWYGSGLKIDVRSELEQASAEQCNWPRPLRVERVVVRQDRVRVEDVVEVEQRLHTHAGDSERLRQPDVELALAWLGQQPSLGHRDGTGRSARRRRAAG